jgi:hypothetical protein
MLIYRRQQLVSNSYVYLSVSNDFVTTPPWTVETFSAISAVDSPELNTSYSLQMQKDSPNYIELSPAECIGNYSTEFLSNRRNLILVMSTNTSQNASLLHYGRYDSPGTSFQKIYSWMCNSSFHNPSPKSAHSCPSFIDRIATAVEDWEPFGQGLKVDRCLSEKVPETCSLQFSLYIMLIVIFCNVAKTIIMAITAYKLKWDPLITIGDAVSSFVVYSDEYTKGCCLLSAQKAKQMEWQSHRRDDSLTSLPWKAEKRRWYHSASSRRWYLTIAL